MGRVAATAKSDGGSGSPLEMEVTTHDVLACGTADPHQCIFFSYLMRVPCDTVPMYIAQWYTTPAHYSDKDPNKSIQHFRDVFIYGYDDEQR